MTPPTMVTSSQQHRANVLGLYLGGAIIVFIIAMIIIFSNYGLPKDPKEWKRLQQQNADKGAIGADVAPQKDVSK